MRSRAQALVMAALLLAAVTAIGCGGQEDTVNEEAEAEYAWLTENKNKLATMRQELADLRAQAEAQEAEGETEGEGEGEEGEGEAGPSLAGQIATKESEVLATADEFLQRVVGYLNVHDPMLEGEPPSERQIEVIRMKSDEDILTASEYIDRGGDYRRAINIYQDAMQLDPDNEKLQSALVAAREMRYMTEERLAEVKKGMSENDVKAVLGPVNLRNVREYPERNVIAWFYPVDDTGAASAVWFRKRGETYSVYKTEFEQVKGRGPDGEEIGE